MLVTFLKEFNSRTYGRVHLQVMTLRRSWRKVMYKFCFKSPEAWWSQWELIAACHCWFMLRWWLDALIVTVTRSQPTLTCDGLGLSSTDASWFFTFAPSVNKVCKFIWSGLRDVNGHVIFPSSFCLFLCARDGPPRWSAHAYHGCYQTSLCDGSFYVLLCQGPKVQLLGTRRTSAKGGLDLRKSLAIVRESKRKRERREISGVPMAAEIAPEEVEALKVTDPPPGESLVSALLLLPY